MLMSLLQKILCFVILKKWTISIQTFVIRNALFLQNDRDYSGNSREITVNQKLPEQPLLQDFAKYLTSSYKNFSGFQKY